MRRICTITSCPALQRLEMDLKSIPTIGARIFPHAAFVIPVRKGGKFPLPDHVRQQAEKSRALDRLGEFALLLG
jgi:hypothetical protein